MNSATESEVAVVFPGQGAQSSAMLTPYQNAENFAERCDLAAAVLKCDLLSADPNRNEVSSILTILASSFAWDDYWQKQGPPKALAGYSIGTWTAIWAAGMVDFTSLMEIISQRARLMNEAAKSHSGGMLAVVGLSEAKIEELVADIDQSGASLSVANFNAPGNVTLAGETSALERAGTAATRAGARQVKPLSIPGAWHCPMMHPATQPFADLLEKVTFSAPSLPIIDNVTGKPLPTKPEVLRRQLTAHLEKPVQWEKTIRYLISLGCDNFIEIGHGSLLSGFGFFIDRSRRHQPYNKDSCAAL